MSRVCEMCGKGYLKGNLVCFSNKKSIKRSYPNIRSVKLVVNGISAKIKLCSGCLSASKRAKSVASRAKAEKAAVAA